MNSKQKRKLRREKAPQVLRDNKVFFKIKSPSHIRVGNFDYYPGKDYFKHKNLTIKEAMLFDRFYMGIGTLIKMYHAGELNNSAHHMPGSNYRAMETKIYNESSLTPDEIKLFKLKSGMHYVYLMRHIITGEYYIGLRTAKGSVMSDYYHGSMKCWETDKNWLEMTILKVFNTRKEAAELETKLIMKRFDDVKLNRNFNVNNLTTAEHAEFIQNKRDILNQKYQHMSIMKKLLNEHPVSSREEFDKLYNSELKKKRIGTLTVSEARRLSKLL